MQPCIICACSSCIQHIVNCACKCSAHGGCSSALRPLALINSLHHHGLKGSQSSMAEVQQQSCFAKGVSHGQSWGQATTKMSPAGVAAAAQQAASPWPQRGPLQAQKPPHASRLLEPGTAAVGGDIAPRRTPSSRLLADSRVLRTGPDRAPRVPIAHSGSSPLGPAPVAQGCPPLLQVLLQVAKLCAAVA